MHITFEISENTMLNLIFTYKGKQRSELIAASLLVSWINNQVIQESDIILCFPAS